MESRNWSSTLVRLLVMIVGLVVVLETIKVLSISVTIHALSQDLGDLRSFAGVAAGFFVGSLSMFPSRRRKRRAMGPNQGYWVNRVSALKRIEEFRRLENLLAQRTTIR